VLLRRVTACVNKLKLLDAHFGIDRRGFEFFMPEQLLDVTDVRPAFEQVRCARMPEQMTRTGPLYARLADERGHHVFLF